MANVHLKERQGNGRVPLEGPQKRSRGFVGSYSGSRRGAWRLALNKNRRRRHVDLKEEQHAYLQDGSELALTDDRHLNASRRDRGRVVLLCLASSFLCVVFPSSVWFCFPLLGGLSFSSLFLGGAALFSVFFDCFCSRHSSFWVVLLGFFFLGVVLPSSASLGWCCRCAFVSNLQFHEVQEVTNLNRVKLNQTGVKK